MNLRICSEAIVELKDFSDIITVTALTSEYDVNNKSLFGNILIKGTYHEKDSKVEFPFENLVPFTVMFKSDDYNIKDIYVDDFRYYEIVSNGIECNFDIVIDYENIIDDKEELITNENVVDVYETIDNENYEMEDSEEIEVEDNINNEETIEKIKEKYDNLLKNVFTNREIDEVEDANINISLNKDNKSDRVHLRSFEETFGTYRVYYPNKESEVEKVCSLEKISISSIYENIANKDFIRKRRIIIKK